MNFFNFLLTRQLVENKTGDTNRANQLGLLTAMIPGPWGMMMGVLLADREEAPPPPGRDGEINKELPAGGTGTSATAAARRS